MSKRLKVGVVGAGLAGKTHLKVLNRIKNVEIKTICDLNQDVVINVAQEFGVPTYYTDFNTMLSETKLDFITICTPPSTHANLCIKAIKSGVHVLVEKPFTETAQEALSILNMLENNKNIKVGVVHNMIFSRTVQKARELVKNGGIGSILNVDIIRAVPFDVDRFISDKNHWCHMMAGGRICEAIPHKIYLAQEFMQKPKIKNILAAKRSNAPWVSFDELLITLESESSIGSIYWSSNAGKHDYLIYLIGTEGTLKIDLYSGVIVKIRRSSMPNKYVRIPYIFGEIRQLLSSFISHNGRLFLSLCGISQAFHYPHEACFNSFIDSITNNREPYINAQKGYDCMLLSEEVSTYLQNLLENK